MPTSKDCLKIALNILEKKLQERTSGHTLNSSAIHCTSQTQECKSELKSTNLLNNSDVICSEWAYTDLTIS